MPMSDVDHERQKGAAQDGSCVVEGEAWWVVWKILRPVSAGMEYCPLLGAYCALGLYQALHHHLTSSPLKSYVAVPIVIPIVQVKELRCKVTKLIRGGI